MCFDRAVPARLAPKHISAVARPTAIASDACGRTSLLSPIHPASPRRRRPSARARLANIPRPLKLAALSSSSRMGSPRRRHPPTRASPCRRRSSSASSTSPFCRPLPSRAHLAAAVRPTSAGSASPCHHGAILAPRNRGGGGALTAQLDLPRLASILCARDLEDRGGAGCCAAQLRGVGAEEASRWRRR